MEYLGGICGQKKESVDAEQDYSCKNHIEDAIG